MPSEDRHDLTSVFRHFSREKLVEDLLARWDERFIYKERCHLATSGLRPAAPITTLLGAATAHHLEASFEDVITDTSLSELHYHFIVPL